MIKQREKRTRLIEWKTTKEAIDGILVILIIIVMSPVFVLVGIIELLAGVGRWIKD